MSCVHVPLAPSMRPSWLAPKTYLFLNFFKTLFYVDGYFDCMYICVPDGCSTQEGQKRFPDPQEQELQIVMSRHVGAGTQISVLWKE